jgi:drug/metabolite transporter (DMT)-like permease
MPLAETTAITFLAPLLVVLLASPALGEKVGLTGWIAALAGFIGVVLIARPGSDLDALGIVFGLFTACANAVYQLLSRVLARTERTITLLFYTALVGSLLFGLALPWSWPDSRPSQLELVLFLAVGLAGGLGHYFFTQAYRYAPASILAPVIYLQLFWAVLLGWLIFDTTPDALSMLGMVIVAGSGLMIAFKSRLRSKNQSRPWPTKAS